MQRCVHTGSHAGAAESWVLTLQQTCCFRDHAALLLAVACRELVVRDQLCCLCAHLLVGIRINLYLLQSRSGAIEHYDAIAQTPQPQGSDLNVEGLPGRTLTLTSTTYSSSSAGASTGATALCRFLAAHANSRCRLLPVGCINAGRC